MKDRIWKYIAIAFILGHVIYWLILAPVHQRLSNLERAIASKHPELVQQQPPPPRSSAPRPSAEEESQSQ